MKSTKSFVSALWWLAIPIIIQNLLSAAVSSADTLMMGVVGQNALSAVSLANQVQYVLSLFYLGLTIGTATMVAQYLGKKDPQAIQRITFLAMRLSVGISALFAVAALLIPVPLMHIFTSDAELIEIGSTYLRLVGVTYVFTGFSQIYLVMLKSMQEVKKSTLIASMTLVLNVALDAVFIFGLFGIPKMGVVGVAIGTVIARAVELVVCLADALRSKRLQFSRSLMFGKDHLLQNSFFKITMPITMQGFVFGGAMAVFAAIMGHLGSDAVAANALASVIQHIATVASFGFAEAGAILLGNELGENKLESARSHAHTLVKMAVCSGILCCILMLLCRPLVLSLTTLTPQAESYFKFMYTVLSINVIFASLTYTMLCGVFCAGGDTKFGLLCDASVMWGFCVVLGLLFAFVFKLPPLVVFMVINLDEFVKTPFVIKHYVGYRWLKNITAQQEPAAESIK